MVQDLVQDHTISYVPTKLSTKLDNEENLHMFTMVYTYVNSHQADRLQAVIALPQL